jgi:hypothetical protein
LTDCDAGNPVGSHLEKEVGSVGHRGANAAVNLPAKKKKSGLIYAVGYLATLLTAVATSGAVAAFALSLPEIRRYLKIASM